MNNINQDDKVILQGNGFSYEVNNPKRTYSGVQVTEERPTKKHRGMKIFLIILAVFLFLGIFIAIASSESFFHLNPYVAVLNIEGTIQSNHSYGDTYNQEFLIDTIDDLMEDSKNCGILLNVNSPGGEVYAGDELYLKLMDYKECTGRPIYAYFGPMAASAAYYISMPADTIVANRNTMTGSIGVKIGTFLDFSELMNTYGVKAVDIDSGKFKNMGSSFREMSPEEKSIWQSYIDEAYDQFVKVIVEGRSMDEATVRKLADGRIYSAQQAMKNGLIDDIGDLAYTKSLMCEYHQNLADCDFIEYIPEEESFSMLDLLNSMSSNARPADAISNKFEKKVYYIADDISLLSELE